MVFDGSDRVTRVEQLLTDRSFNALQAGTATRADATARLGRPGQVTTYPARGEEVWTYRYMSGTTYMLGDVYFNAADGVVKGVSTYFDPAYYSTYSS